MEVMYLNKNHELFKKNIFTGVYGDKNNIENICISGIEYDDNWTVKRFLNGYKLKLNEVIIELFNEFDLSVGLLKRRICELSKGEYKLVLLIYSLLNNKDNIILDYFDKNLSYKYKKRVISYFKAKFNGTLIVFSNDLVFLNQLCSMLIVYKDNKIIFNDKFSYIYKSKIKLEYPEIIKFIRLSNKSGANLAYTVDNHELLKDIYRSIR